MKGRVCELFAGVGGFRIGLASAGWQVVWSNQWEPASKRQHASNCYVKHFGKEGHSNRNIRKVKVQEIPPFDMLVGGFPCQDFSVAKTKARGIHGSRGGLWWQIYRILQHHLPGTIFLENVDRLLKSPRHKPGRDFGVILWCLQNLDYTVEWRVVNAADYGAAQRRRRVFLVATRKGTPFGDATTSSAKPALRVFQDGVLASAFPVIPPPLATGKHPWRHNAILPVTLRETRKNFKADFGNAGILRGRKIWSRVVVPKQTNFATLESVLQANAPEKYYLAPEEIPKWEYLKKAKAEPRTARNGFTYRYVEGAMPFPDPIDRPSRTLMTAEGGAGASRFKHVIKDPTTGRVRRLTPVEVERLNQFPENWTEGMPEGWRYFCMGNALVVGLIEKVGRVLQAQLQKPTNTPETIPTPTSSEAATLLAAA